MRNALRRELDQALGVQPDKVGTGAADKDDALAAGGASQALQDNAPSSLSFIAYSSPTANYRKGTTGGLPPW